MAERGSSQDFECSHEICITADNHTMNLTCTIGSLCCSAARRGGVGDTSLSSAIATLSVNTTSSTAAPKLQPKSRRAADRHAAAAAPRLGQGCVVNRVLARLLTPRVNVGYRKDALHTAQAGKGGHRGGGYILVRCACWCRNRRHGGGGGRGLVVRVPVYMERTAAPRLLQNTTRVADHHADAAAPKPGQGCVVMRVLATDSQGKCRVQEGHWLGC